MWGSRFAGHEGKEAIHILLTIIVRDLKEGARIPKAMAAELNVIGGSDSIKFIRNGQHIDHPNEL